MLFRSLNLGLLNSRGLTDRDKLKKEVENMSYELDQIQVNEGNKEYRKTIRTLGLSGIILTGSLVVSFLPED